VEKNTRKNSFFYEVFTLVSGTFADPKNGAVKTGKISYGRDFSAK
jgi:hypothetical protein